MLNFVSERYCVSSDLAKVYLYFAIFIVDVLFHISFRVDSLMLIYLSILATFIEYSVAG